MKYLFAFLVGLAAAAQLTRRLERPALPPAPRVVAGEIVTVNWTGQA